MPRTKKVKETVVPPAAPVVVEDVVPVVEDVPKTPKTIIKKTRKPNAWVLHSKKVQAENPGISYREVLKLAKLSYKRETPTQE